MDKHSRLLQTVLFLGLFLALFFLGFFSPQWKGAFFFLSGIFLCLSYARFFLSPKAPTTPDVSGKEQNRLNPENVSAPSRNFEEMLERLGSDQTFLNVILNGMGEGVLLLNQADRLLLMNPRAEKILDIAEKSGIGKHYLEVVRHKVLADLLAQSKREGLSSGEMELSGRDEKTFAVSVAAIRVEGNHLLGQIVVLSDITSMKRLMRMRTEFVANVSHELKTPLTAILGYVETLLAGAIDDKKNRGQFLQKISDQAQRLNALITDVLELSKIESGVYIGSLEPVDLAEVAQQAVELLKAKWEAKEILMRQDIPSGFKVVAHKEGLFHVFENLLDNAIKYSPSKSKIRIYSKGVEEGKIEFSVEDHGVGIPKEAQSRVFERFFRVDVSRSREAGGTGLGLSIVKHLVEKMDGQVSLKSEEGQGSTFTVALSNVSQ